MTVTQSGFKKLEDELNDLITIGRKEIAEKIKEARSFGDLSENAEYDAAKNEQAEMEARIIEIENIIKHAKIVNDDEIKTDVVSVGCKVKVHDKKYNEDVEYFIVGATEADPFNFKISDESPVGNALIGHKVGQKVKIDTPDGINTFTILSIDK
ncbi:MAG: transcription elongation factor GreA [Clostridiales bacterium]|nr:transcription elongation factor GreA [Clostridiales bacterium]